MLSFNEPRDTYNMYIPYQISLSYPFFFSIHLKEAYFYSVIQHSIFSNFTATLQRTKVHIFLPRDSPFPRTAFSLEHSRQYRFLKFIQFSIHFPPTSFPYRLQRESFFISTFKYLYPYSPPRFDSPFIVARVIHPCHTV